MKYRIKKGKHRSWPPMVGSSIWRREMYRQVIFDITSKYDLKSPDQDDTNKLFGLAFTPWWRALFIVISWPLFIVFNIRRQHSHSARFGWRYDKGMSSIVLYAYCYIDGQRVIQELCPVSFDKKYQLEILIHNGEYIFRAWKILENGRREYTGGWRTSTGHTLKWSFPLGLYFGGNQVAPHTITIKMKNIC